MRKYWGFLLGLLVLSVTMPVQLFFGGLDLTMVAFPEFTRLIPKIAAILTAVLYYMDFLTSKSPQFYDPGHIEEFDFIIVGGGSSGSVIANRLSQHYRVLLLEAGGTPNPLTYIPALALDLQRLDATDWLFRTEPQNNCALALEEQRVLWPRGKGLGGSSNLNFMLYQRGHPRDYQSLVDATGDPEWSYEQLLPFFKKSEDYHGYYRDSSEKYHAQGGPLHVSQVKSVYLDNEFLAAVKEKGFEERDFNTEQRPGFSRVDATMKDGRRWSTYEAFIRPVLHRSNLVIYRHARAIKIHIDTTRRAYGVTYVRHGVKKFVRANREIVVSAGTVDTPKLLMLSGVGDRTALHSVGLACRVDLPGVGSNLEDHVTVFLGPFLLNGRTLLADRDLNLASIKSYLGRGEGPLASLVGVSVLGFVASSLSEDPTWPDIGLIIAGTGVSRYSATDFTRILGMKPGLLSEYLGPHVGRDANFALIYLGKPKSRGEIRLASRSPWDKPLIQPNYYSHPEDMIKMKEAVKLAIDIYENTQAFRSLGTHLVPNPFPSCAHFPVKSDDYIECYIRHMTGTIYHPSGTCAMGKVNDTAAVVDSQLRVRKVQGLRVADASVLSVITNANLNAPAILIGERAAFLIRRHWAKQAEVSFRPNYYIYQDNHLHCFYNSNLL